MHIVYHLINQETKENLEFKAELPNDIKNLIEKLRKNN